VKVGVGSPTQVPMRSRYLIEISAHHAQRINHQNVAVDDDQMSSVAKALVGERHDV
jgi:hypothetical protein